jgi:hypothetical protein
MTDDVEIPLAGGMGSGGLVVRVGDTIRRPIVEQTAAVESFLRHLEAVGFDGAPRALGRDSTGRCVLSWMEGDVAVPPYPAWAANEALLVSVADLQRRLHEASRSFDSPVDAHWYRPNLPDIGPGAIVGHNDLCIENVVVRDGRAVAFIDFDFAAPSDPLLDIAIACRHWVPLKHPDDLPAGWPAIDQVRRFRVFCDAHGLSATQREGVIGFALDFLDRALVTMREKAESGLPLYAKVWEAGYPQQNRRSHAWLVEQRDKGMAS